MPVNRKYNFTHLIIKGNRYRHPLASLRDVSFLYLDVSEDARKYCEQHAFQNHALFLRNLDM